MDTTRALSEQIGKRLKAQGKTLATAESCTGGLIGHLITEVPGSSAYYLGGVISYSNEVKHHVLGVRLGTLEQEGAVSAACAREMAVGVRQLMDADIGISVTGIAGPGGGTVSKPVGLTYIHLSTADGEYGMHYHWQGERSENKLSSARAALRLLLAYLDGREEITSGWAEH